ncbi:atp18 subunit J of the mitochondrial F1F0 ATP synthase [Scheffersomyces spartinae]|uniref:Atp18 subunit J of the mitochondrial F1F0 ATP synthase n=1 Tax=Scheffersomyces spartinae TaxID=45513 RepID=A0A9P7VDI3_9ASCO|nr:atp18 subunit J of the mitochondrial F1F0 ATP synthase [Scheffersomyces spartinae]KAG7195951.1 atp18 subunit J of the mitochondrial F1F0 ATP synthase [Scheffersomyces spartinae]
MALPKFPTPVLKVYWPFAAGAAVSYFLVWKGGNALQDTDEYINDPRHPRFQKGGKFIDLANKD